MARGLLATVVGSGQPLLAQDPVLDESFPLRVDSVTVHGQGGSLARVLAATVGPDGTCYVGDFGNHQVVAFKPSGDIGWVVGGQGRGPGEFQTVYRLFVGSDNSLHVLDRGTGEISRFARGGRFLDRRRLQFVFTQIDAIVVLRDGRFAIAGVTDYGVAERDAAIHIFNRELEHIRSFGSLPDSDVRTVLSYWGAGAINLDRSGNLLYSRRLPYTIYRFRPDGELIGLIEPPFTLRGRPEDAIVVEEGPGTRRISRGGDVDRPLPAIELGERYILAGRLLANGDKYWDLFDQGGELVGSTSVPKEWGILAGFDAERNVLWVVGEHGLEPVVMRVFVTWNDNPG